MGNLSEYIQCASSDTRPPMLYMTDFASWQQHIRLYFWGKENGVNILKSIAEGPFQMGTIREPLAEGMEGAPHLGPERPRVYSDLSPEEKDQYNANMRATNILLQGLPKDIYTLIDHYTDAKDIWDNVKMLLEGSELTKEDQESQLYDDFKHFRQHKGETIHDYYVRFAKLINDMRNIKMTMSRMQLNLKFVNNMLPEWGRFVTAVKLNRGLRDSNYDQLMFKRDIIDVRGPIHEVEVQLGHIARNYTQPKRPQNSDYYKDKMLLMQAQENGVALDVEQLLFLACGQDNAIDEDVDEQPVQDLALNVDNVFQADDCDAFDSDVDEALTAQTMFMANLSSADPVNDEVRPSYDSNILSEIQDHDHYQDFVCAHHEEHAMHDNVQHNHVVDSHADYTSNSNMIPYDQCVKDNVVPAVHNNVSFVPNDAYMMIYNDMYKYHSQSVSKTSPNTVVKNSLTAKLTTYKEQVELSYVSKKGLKQKENKYLEDFLDMKSLKEKVEDRLFKQDRSLQIVHMLCRPKPYYNELNKAIVHNTEDTLEITKIPRRKMNDKMKDLECVTHKVKIVTYDYSKKNFLATFTPHKQLTPEQIFWSQDLIKMKSKALKEQTTVSRPIKMLTVKHDEIKRKNLLIANDNLITECLSKEVFSVATNSELNVARFTEMHVANTIVETRCLELEAELYNLRDKSHNDNHDDFRNNPPTPDKDTLDFDSFFVIGKMQASLQVKDNVIRQLKKQISHLQETCSNTDRTLKVRAVDAQITQLNEKVDVLQAQNDLFSAKNDKIKQHYKELYDSIKITRAKHIKQVTAFATENVNLKAQILDTGNSVSKYHVKPKVLAPRKYAIDVEPIVPRLRNNREAHLDYLRHLKESVKTIRDIVEEAKVVRPLDSLINYACRYTKHSQELLEYTIGTCQQDSH
nr:integrase, catalytic region, zinc finger, CCHC-type, peptidase aspartic, catalytic [Tanacetum cinerariifolium]